MIINTSLFYLLITISMTIGMMIQNVIINNSSSFSFFNTYNIFNAILLMLVIISNNNLLILTCLSLFLINLSGLNNILILVHFILVIFNSYLLFDSSIINIILLMISIDIISLINIIVIRSNINNSIWYYFLYQTIITILIYNCIMLDLTIFVGLLYYYKLGSGIGGYYIPNLYSYIINNNMKLIIYIGLTNIILMFNPICLFSSYTISNYNISYYILAINILTVLYICTIYIYNGYLFINTWLYSICISTIVLSNVYNIFAYISNISYNLYYYLYYFTLTSLLIWYTLILTLVLYY